jgi:hypothetical protein
LLGSGSNGKWNMISKSEINAFSLSTYIQFSLCVFFLQNQPVYQSRFVLSSCVACKIYFFLPIYSSQWAFFSWQLGPFFWYTTSSTKDPQIK